jgi:hypothetical protein
MVAMFDRLTDVDFLQQQVEETLQVWYHIPSRMFNLAQLQRRAAPNRLLTTVNDG